MPKVIASDRDRRRREKALNLVRSGETKAEAARQVGRSRMTVYRWWREYSEALAVSRAS